MLLGGAAVAVMFVGSGALTSAQTTQSGSRFTINRRRKIYVEPGRYEFNENFILANTNAAAPFSMNLRYGNGEFYDGYRRNYTVGGTFRMNQHFNVSLSDQINASNSSRAAS